MDEFEEIQDAQLSELIEAQHDSLMDMLGKMMVALSAEKKDAALHKLITTQISAIAELNTKISQLAGKEVKVETNQDKVVKSIEALTKCVEASNKYLVACMDKMNEPMAEPKKKQFEFEIVRDINGRMSKIKAVEK